MRKDITDCFDDTLEICDNFSTNGTWLNGVRMQPGKKYQLATNDEINFAITERVIFDKREQSTQPTGVSDEKVIALLEIGMATYAKSRQTDEDALKLIAGTLTDAPLYFPVEIDLEAIFGSLDPAKLNLGDKLSLQKDVKMRILTRMTESGVEFVPMFTSKAEVNKGPRVSIARYYPQDYLPLLIQMDRPAVINPFSASRFILCKEFITEVLIPLVNNKTNTTPPVNFEEQQDQYMGKIVGNRYFVLKRICPGSQTAAYHVQDIRTNQILNMKVWNNFHIHYSLVTREALLQELYMKMKLDHPAIPKVVDIIDDGDSILVFRDDIKGETLETLVRRFGAQPADRVVDWAKQICDALCYLHSFNPPRIYQDMKPENIIMKTDGQLMLMDVGTMVCTYQENQNHDHCFRGTKGYASPEQYVGQLDMRTDIYGIGMTMHHLVTGIDPRKPPYMTEPICQINPNLPKGLEYIISKCIQPNPKDRYQNCNELMKDLNSYLELPRPKGLFRKLFGKK